MQASHSKLEQEVAALGDLSRDGLAALWTKAHGALPPKGVRRDLLIRSAAWHLQAKRLRWACTENSLLRLLPTHPPPAQVRHQQGRERESRSRQSRG
jgi:hypothetical protein